uniref:MHC class II beta chain N-terminal domain-containing protein n=1 Tax=Ficedula albicollis TaxID=59894 RepID=A0A803VB16_FICAL
MGCGVGIRCGRRSSGECSGAPHDLCPAHTGVFQFKGWVECHFSNGTEKVRLVQKYICNREEYLRYDADVGRYEGFNPYGEWNARRFNSNPKWMQYIPSRVD